MIISKFFTFLKLIIKHRNASFQITINPPDYHFRYFIEIDKNNFYNNQGYYWVSDEMEVTPLEINDDSMIWVGEDDTE